MWGEFLCNNVNEVSDFHKDLSTKTYEWEAIMEAHSITSKIFMDKEGKLPNDFVALEDTMLPCEHQLEIPLFHPP